MNNFGNGSLDEKSCEPNIKDLGLLVSDKIFKGFSL